MVCTYIRDHQTDIKSNAPLILKLAQKAGIVETKEVEAKDVDTEIQKVLKEVSKHFEVFAKNPDASEKEKLLSIEVEHVPFSEIPHPANQIFQNIIDEQPKSEEEITDDQKDQPPEQQAATQRDEKSEGKTPSQKGLKNVEIVDPQSKSEKWRLSSKIVGTSVLLFTALAGYFMRSAPTPPSVDSLSGIAHPTGSILINQTPINAPTPLDINVTWHTDSKGIPKSNEIAVKPLALDAKPAATPTNPAEAPQPTVPLSPSIPTMEMPLIIDPRAPKEAGTLAIDTEPANAPPSVQEPVTPHSISFAKMVAGFVLGALGIGVSVAGAYSKASNRDQSSLDDSQRTKSSEAKTVNTQNPSPIENPPLDPQVKEQLTNIMERLAKQYALIPKGEIHGLRGLLNWTGKSFNLTVNQEGEFTIQREESGFPGDPVLGQQLSLKNGKLKIKGLNNESAKIFLNEVDALTKMELEKIEELKRFLTQQNILMLIVHPLVPSEELYNHFKRLDLTHESQVFNEKKQYSKEFMSKSMTKYRGMDAKTFFQEHAEKAEKKGDQVITRTAILLDHSDPNMRKGQIENYKKHEIALLTRMLDHIKKQKERLQAEYDSIAERIIAQKDKLGKVDPRLFKGLAEEESLLTKLEGTGESIGKAEDSLSSLNQWIRHLNGMTKNANRKLEAMNGALNAYGKEGLEEAEANELGNVLKDSADELAAAIEELRKLGKNEEPLKEASTLLNEIDDVLAAVEAAIQKAVSSSQINLANPILEEGKGYLTIEGPTDKVDK